MKKEEEQCPFNHETGLPEVTNRLSGQYLEAGKIETGLPDEFNRKSGWFQQMFHANSVFRILRTGYPVLRQREGLANPVFRIENPVIQMLSREQPKLIWFRLGKPFVSN